MDFVTTMIEIASGEIGVTEEPRGSNKGPRVAAYQARTGYTKPVAWCLCFLYWCADEACKAVGADNEILRTGSCDLLLAWAREHQCLFDEPQTGDWGLVMRSSSDATHVFLVKDASDSRLTSIEGNTNSDGSRDGYAVLQRTRKRLDNYSYVRAANVLAASTQPNATLTLIAPNGATVGELPVIRGSARAPIRLVAKALGLRLGEGIQPVDDEDIKWDADRQAVMIAGRALPGQVLLIDGVTYAPIRSLSGFLGWDIAFDPSARTVRATAP